MVFKSRPSAPSAERDLGSRQSRASGTDARPELLFFRHFLLEKQKKATCRGQPPPKNLAASPHKKIKPPDSIQRFLISQRRAWLAEGVTRQSSFNMTSGKQRGSRPALQGYMAKVLELSIAVPILNHPFLPRWIKAILLFPNPPYYCALSASAQHCMHQLRSPFAPTFQMRLELDLDIT